MKFVKHVSFFFLEERMKYVNTIIHEVSQNYRHETDIFIHTNDMDLFAEQFVENKNGKVVVVWHDLTNTDPYYLTWKCRDLMAAQLRDNLYDVFMYIEDDILVPWSAIEYWLKYSPLLLPLKLNTGFLRIEKTLAGEEVNTDIIYGPLKKYTTINNEIFYINYSNPYCAFWIYDKTEFARFVASPLYDISNIPNYGIRESSAIGLHGLHTEWYLCTVLPWDASTSRLNDGCKIYHLPNNYALKSDTCFGKLPYKNVAAAPPSVLPRSGP